MTDNDPLLSDEQIAALCPGLTQPARRLAFLHQRGFVRAYFRAGRVCLERVHYEAVCRGQFGHVPVPGDNPRPRIASLQGAPA